MTATVDMPPKGRLLSTWRDAMQGEGEAWLYVFKGLIAVMLAGGLAMRLELPSPSVAMVTVLVVMNRQSGMVLAKSFYRILGTLLGVSAAVVMVGLFPQAPGLLLTTISIWTGLCAAGATMLRGFRSYTFVLAGYTVAMITLPIVNTPTLIFDQASNRLCEVVLGLAVAAVVFDGLFPRPLAGLVKAQTRQNLSYLLSEIRASLSLRSHDPQRRIATARRADGLEGLIANAVFEGPWLSAVSRPLRRSNHAFMQASTRMHAWERLCQRLNRAGDAATVAALEQLALPLRQRLEQDTSDDEALIHDLRQLGLQVQPAAEVARQALPASSRQAFDTGSALLRRTAKALVRTAQTRMVAEAGRSAEAMPRTRFSRAHDPVAVAITLIRTIAVCMVFGMLWMSHILSSSGTAMFIIIALTTMLAAAPNPLAAVKLAATGHIIAPILGLVCFSIMPSLTTFPLLVLGLTPFLLLTLYIFTRPGWAGLGGPMSIGLLVALNIGQTVSLNATQYFNEAAATVAGVLLVAVGFMILPGPAGSPAQIVRFRKALDESIRLAATRPLKGLSEQIESRNRDLGLQLLAQQSATNPEVIRYLEHVADVQECCYALVSLRESLTRDDASPDAIGPVSDAVQAVVAAWPPATATLAQRQMRDATLARAVNSLPEPLPVTRQREHLYLLIDALADLDQRDTGRP